MFLCNVFAVAVCARWGGGGLDSVGLVEQRPLLVFLLGPFVVSLLLGKCFVTALMVSPGQDANCLFLIAASR
jgi:hypothetical protein